MSLRIGSRRLRIIGISAVAAIAAAGLGFGVPAAMADTDAKPTQAEALASSKSNAELLEPKCGVPADRDIKVTTTLFQTASGRGVNDKVMLAMFETGWVESHMNNLNCGDRDSVGVFQQRPSMGWCDPAALCQDVEHATNKFLDQAIPNDKKNPDFTPGELAQSVQRSAFPDRYDESEGKAKDMINEVSDAPLPDPAWPSIKEGSSGNDVVTAQHLLTGKGQTATADGKFGPKTTAAAKAFQKEAGLEVDGVIGKASWPKLVATLANGDEGHAVKALQSQLGVTVDGKFGPATEKALKSFQKRAEIKESGKADADTWFALIGT